jgi:hypothetical protein
VIQNPTEFLPVRDSVQIEIEGGWRKTTLLFWFQAAERGEVGICAPLEGLIFVGDIYHIFINNSTASLPKLDDLKYLPAVSKHLGMLVRTMGVGTSPPDAFLPPF